MVKKALFSSLLHYIINRTHKTDVQNSENRTKCGRSDISIQFNVCPYIIAANWAAVPSATCGWCISFACVDVAMRPKTNEGCVSVIEVGDILQKQDNTWREVVSFAAMIYSHSAPDITVEVCHGYLKCSYCRWSLGSLCWTNSMLPLGLYVW
jgi:hypothetical protein